MQHYSHWLQLAEVLLQGSCPGKLMRLTKKEGATGQQTMKTRLCTLQNQDHNGDSGSQGPHTASASGSFSPCMG